MTSRRRIKEEKSMTGWTTDTVLMPVPLRLAQRVADFMTSLDEVPAATAARTADSDEVAAVVVPDQGSWTEAMIFELVDSLTYKGVTALLDRCAAEPDQWVVKSAVEEASAINPIQLRNELGALSKLTKRL